MLNNAAVAGIPERMAESLKILQRLGIVVQGQDIPGECPRFAFKDADLTEARDTLLPVPISELAQASKIPAWFPLGMP